MAKLSKGFTLVELLVAIAIFAVLSVLGWKIFDHVARVKERNMVKEKTLIDLQTAYQRVLKDSVQIVPISASVNKNIEPALILQDNQLSFSKSGVVDPLQQGYSPFERIEYSYDVGSKSIIRSRYLNLNRTNNQTSENSVLLNNIDEFKVEILKPNTSAAWPENSNEENRNTQLLLPRGIKLIFTQNGTDYEWIFRLLDTDELAKNIKETAP
jgi:general secretion pathway protein J